MSTGKVIKEGIVRKIAVRKTPLVIRCPNCGHLFRVWIALEEKEEDEQRRRT